jgi:protein ImuA
MNRIALEDIPLLWRAQSLATPQDQCVPTGYAALDEALGGGWPLPSLIELLSDEAGMGELRLLLGLLQRGEQTSNALRVVDRKIALWLSPPYEVHAVALAQYGLTPSQHWLCSISSAADLQWAMSQALRSGACHTVLAWAARLQPAALRTLKLAAHTGGTVGVLFRSAQDARVASPATLRLRLEAHDGAIQIAILKMRGRAPRVIHILPDESSVLTSAER